MVTYVSTIVGFGTNTSLSGTPITPSSMSEPEPVYTGSSTQGSLRYWEYVADGDGAVRVDASLSMPGINAHLYGGVRLTVFKKLSPSSTESVPLYVEGYGSTPIFTLTTYAINPPEYGSGSFIVEAGATYIIRLQAVNLTGSHHYWGLILRMSSLRPPDPTWYQMPNRTTNTYTSDALNQPIDTPGTGWNNTTQINPWDRDWGYFDYSFNRFGFIGRFEWNRSFHGLDPITGIPGDLAVTHTWQQACNAPWGVFPIVYAAPDFDGTLQGPPPGPYPWMEPFMSNGGKPSAWNFWGANTSGIGIFEYADSEMKQAMGGMTLSLNHSAWQVGPNAGYTDVERAAFTGYDLAEIVGFINEELLPETVDVWVVPDWYGAIPGADSWEPAPAQWWAGPTQWRPDVYWESGSEMEQDPNALGLPWGPFIHLLGHPEGDTIDQVRLVLGEADGLFPASYISRMGMVHLGDYHSTMYGESSGSMTAWQVPKEVWQHALEIEAEMIEADVMNDEYAEDPELMFEFFMPSGLTFICGTAEALAPTPISPGVSQPDIYVELSYAKGLHDLLLWPRITYRPVRFQVVLAPEMEIPLYNPTGGPPAFRQHFEPIPME